MTILLSRYTLEQLITDETPATNVTEIMTDNLLLTLLDEKEAALFTQLRQNNSLIKFIGQLLALSGIACFSHLNITFDESRHTYRIAPSASDEIIAYEGWQQSLFLFVFCKTLLPLYVQKRDNRTEQLVILEELFVAINAYRILRKSELINKREENNFADLKTFIQQLLQEIQDSLLVGDELCVPCGSVDHAVYLYIIKYAHNHCLVRLDNLLGTNNISGDDELRQYHKHEHISRNKRECRPFVAGTFDLADTDAIEKYLVDLLSIRHSTDKTWQYNAKDIINILYENTNCFSQYPEKNYRKNLPLATCLSLDNCVYLTYEYGVRVRLALSIENRGEQKLFDWFQSQQAGAIVETVRASADGNNVFKKLQEIRCKRLSQIPIPETCPLTKGDFIQAVKRYYSSKAFTYLPRQLPVGVNLVSEDNRYTELGESFINLVVVKQSEQKDKEQALTQHEQKNKEQALMQREQKDKEQALTQAASLSSPRELRFSSFEAILQPKEPIALTDLLPDRLNQPIPIEQIPLVERHLLIEGRAGIGKTTLSKYLAYQWACGEKGEFANSRWLQVDLVLLLPLRQLLEERDTLSFAQFVCKHCVLYSQQEEFTKAHVIEAHLPALEQNGKVLYILDGYDEIESLIREKGNPNTQKRRDLLEALWGKPFWMMTSRPYFVNEALLKPHRRLENIGFLEEDVKNYINRYFDVIKQPKFTAASLIHTLFESPNLKAISGIPINLQWLCAIHASGDLRPSDTLTTVYQQMIAFRAKQHAKRQHLSERATGIGRSAFLKFYQPHFDILADIAWNMMQTQRLVTVPNDDIEYASFDDARIALNELGLLQPTVMQPCTEAESIGDTSYYFVHLTVQEYFAARHWVKLFVNTETEKQALNYFRERWYDPHFEVLWRFVAGLLASNDKEKKEGEKKMLPLFWAEFFCLPKEPIGFVETLFIIGAVGECYVAGDPAPDWQRKVIRHLETWLQSRRREIGLDLLAQTLNLYPHVINVLEECIGQLIQAKKYQHDRHFACELLRKLSTPVCIDKLLTCLRNEDKDKYVRALVVQALCKWVCQVSAAERTAVFQALLDCLRDEDSWVRELMVRALGQLFPHVSAADSAVVVKALLDCLRDEDKDVIAAAVQDLGELFPHVSAADSAVVVKALLDCLRDEDKDVIAVAVQALGELFPHVSAADSAVVVEALRDCLRDEDSWVRKVVVQALGQLFPHVSAADSAVVVKALRDCPRDEDKYVRKLAVGAIAQLGSQASAAKRAVVVEALLDCLRDDEYVKEMVVQQALAKLGCHLSVAEKAVVVEALLDCLQDKYLWVREAAVQALGELFPHVSAADSAVVVKAVLDCLQDKYLWVREAAVQALGELFPHVSAADSAVVVKAVLDCLQDKYLWVRHAAVQALGKLGCHVSVAERAVVVEALLDCLRDESEYVREAAVQALGQLFPYVSAVDRDVLKALIACLRDKKWQVREAAVQALGQLFPHQVSAEETTAVLKALIACLRDKKWQVREAAVQALGNWGCQVSAAERAVVVKALRDCLRDENKDVIKAVVQALGELIHQAIAADTVTVVKVLLDSLRDKNRFLREVASTVLLKFSRSLKYLDIILAAPALGRLAKGGRQMGLFARQQIHDEQLQNFENQGERSRCVVQ